MSRQPTPAISATPSGVSSNPCCPPPKPGGRPIKYPRREVVNAIRYVLRTGCAWRMLPNDLPLGGSPFTTSASGGRTEPGSASMKHSESRSAWPRVEPPAHRGRHRQPIGQDHGKGGPRGYGAGRKVCGRKRHIVVDTTGLVLAVAVHPANVQARDGANLALAQLPERAPHVKHIRADGAYSGKPEQWAKDYGGRIPEPVRRRPGQRGVKVVPRRWVMERTFGWLGLCRRLSKDYEVLAETTRAWDLRCRCAARSGWRSPPLGSACLLMEPFYGIRPSAYRWFTISLLNTSHPHRLPSRPRCRRPAAACVKLSATDRRWGLNCRAGSIRRKRRAGPRQTEVPGQPNRIPNRRRYRRPAARRCAPSHC